MWHRARASDLPSLLRASDVTAFLPPVLVHRKTVLLVATLLGGRATSEPSFTSFTTTSRGFGAAQGRAPARQR
jgi:hypothetical protein